MSRVEDKDRGWKKVKAAAARADGLELRAGILNWKLRYPKRGNSPGTEIAKVAGILKIHKAIGEAYDAERGTVDAAFDAVHKHVVEGKTGIADLIFKRIGIPLRERMRKVAMGKVRRRTGRMEEAIRATVFDGVRPGGRGPAHAGTVVAGDDPKRPRPSQKIA